MTMLKTAPPKGIEPAFSVQLLDPNQGHALIRWKVAVQPVVRIGRGEQNEIAVSDPCVSRSHAELHWHQNRWKLVNLGRNGTLIDGMQVNDVDLRDGARFQLGPMGPTLQLCLTEPASAAAMGTVAGGIEEPPCIEIDHSQKEKQVSEIAASDYFQQLQQMAKQLKNRAPEKTEVFPK